jgi:hypothetical protein
VAAGDGNRVDRFGSQLVGDLAKAALVEPPQVIGCVDGIEEGGL